MGLTRCGGVFPFVGSVHPRQPEVYCVIAIPARVWGPHTRERLANCPYGSFHRTGPGWVSVGGDGAGSVPNAEDLQGGYGVFELREKGVDGQFDTKRAPSFPMVGRSSVGAITYSCVHCLLSKVEVTNCCSSGGGIQSRQGILCG